MVSQTQYLSGWRSNWTMSLLVIIYAANLADRTILNVLQQPIKVDLELADWQLGLVSGTSFAILYTVLGLLVARLSEHWNRPRLLAACAFIWSIFTALCGAATSFVQLLLFRAGVAVGESGGTPISHSLISDYYPVEQRASKLALFSTGATLGIIGGALLGGSLGETLGWRWAFVLAGLPGILLAVLAAITLSEPRHGTSEDVIPPFSQVVGTLARKPTFRQMALATSLTLFSTSAINAFAVPHFMRTFGMPLVEAGLLGGAGAGIALLVGTLIGGYLGSALGRSDRRKVLWMLCVGLLIACPLCVIAFLSTDLRVASFAFLALNVCLALFQGPVYSINHSFVTSRMRATASAVLLVFIQIIGLGLGPLLIGILSDQLAAANYPGEDFVQECDAGASPSPVCVAASAIGLRLALASCAIAILWGAFHHFMASRTLRDDVIE